MQFCRCIKCQTSSIIFVILFFYMLVFSSTSTSTSSLRPPHKPMASREHCTSLISPPGHYQRLSSPPRRQRGRGRKGSTGGERMKDRERERKKKEKRLQIKITAAAAATCTSGHGARVRHGGALSPVASFFFFFFFLFEIITQPRQRGGNQTQLAPRWRRGSAHAVKIFPPACRVRASGIF